ncbi:hypothetical protein [Solidesulfovibrio sp.]|uniref:hypothetical protein n=1 Tax=Solidesulfovibrio sp. TaxID=2910990 RepID=UPI002B201879|nr:hypothetical protein [Solidesulfovibrio sp.]MEA5090008.1 hypothetical protein [Solidesulfovibrio sp.]
MKHRSPPSREDTLSLDAFAALMADSAALRRQAATAILAGRPVPAETSAALAQCRDVVDEAVDRDGMAVLPVDEDRVLRLDLSEEAGQLENDVLYLEEGREALMKHLGRQRHGLRDAVRQGLRELAVQGIETLLCQADALLRAPGQRFVTAVQPAWNAVGLGRFAAARATRTVLWSAAPLSGPGIADLHALPRRACVLAGSLGRQIVDATGRESASPLSLAKASLLEGINARLAMLLADPDWRAFAYVGSGLQFRRGETVIARQDSRGSIDEDASLALLEHVHDIVDAVDPEREHFRVEDDGCDVVVTPTANAADAGLEYAAREGLRALELALGADFAKGPHLVCCTGQDGLELLEALLEKNRDVRCLFVGDREDLGRKARELCPHTALAAHPDIAAALFSAAAP